MANTGRPYREDTQMKHITHLLSSIIWTFPCRQNFCLINAGTLLSRHPQKFTSSRQTFTHQEAQKLNETARSYQLIAEQAKNIDGLEFVWITDGKGWLSSKHALHETFDVLDTIYNIADLEAGILNTLLR